MFDFRNNIFETQKSNLKKKIYHVYILYTSYAKIIKNQKYKNHNIYP